MAGYGFIQPERPGACSIPPGAGRCELRPRRHKRSKVPCPRTTAEDVVPDAGGRWAACDVRPGVGPDAGTRPRPGYRGVVPEPTAPRSFWAVARQPRVVGLLVLLLVAAAVCARLGVWQLDRAQQRAELAAQHEAAELEAAGPEGVGVLLPPQSTFPGELVGRPARGAGEDAPDCPSPALQRILGKPLGIPLFQEQAMPVAVHCAGFPGGEADQLRRSMGTFRSTGGVHHMKERLLSGMIANGYDPAFAARIWTQLEGFGAYGFPESHAASFALIAYASAWLKCHYPDVFCAALLNSQPMVRRGGAFE